MAFQRTTAQDKIAELKARVKIVQGGTSSSKTFSIIPILIMYAIHNKNKEISIVSESIPHLRRGAIRDFLKIMDMLGNSIGSQWNKSTLTYYFSSGSFIEFFSADQSDKLRGARRDVLFVNEANNVDWEAYHQMAVRTREYIYIDYNPTAEFWAHTELINQPDTDFVKLTYLDNEALEPAIVKEIELAREKAKTSEYWANWWKVYGLGETGSLQGTIFSNWEQVDAMPTGYNWKAYGLDWGFSLDPCAFVEVAEVGEDLYINEIIYENNLTNTDLGKRIEKYKREEIVADSAEPKSIEDMRRLGFRIRPCKKGSDSIRAGIHKLQQKRLKITKNSTNIIKELRNYQWADKKDGVPIDSFNHALDAIRYISSEKINARSGQYTIR